MSKIKFRSFPQNTANYSKTAAPESSAARRRSTNDVYAVQRKIPVSCYHGHVGEFCGSYDHPVGRVAMVIFKLSRKEHCLIRNRQRCQSVSLANSGKPFPWGH